MSSAVLTDKGVKGPGLTYGSRRKQLKGLRCQGAEKSPSPPSTLASAPISTHPGDHVLIAAANTSPGRIWRGRWWEMGDNGGNMSMSGASDVRADSTGAGGGARLAARSNLHKYGRSLSQISLISAG